MVGIFGPSSPYVSPSDECVHVFPRSSLRKTAGPNHAEPPAAYTDRVAESHCRSWIGQPSHIGPRIDQVWRASSPSRMKAPFVVPTSSIVWVIVVLPASLLDSAASVPGLERVH